MRFLDSILKDVRYACRAFQRAPLPAGTIVMTIGLGLGAVAVVFTVLNGLVFNADDVRNPGELFAISRRPAVESESATYTRSQYETLVRETTVFSAAFAMTSNVSTWTGGRRLEGPFVTGNFFGVLGVDAARGRTLTPLDDEPGRPAVVVLSHRAWTQWFAGDPAVVGRSIDLTGLRVTVVGVTPESFRGLEPAAPDFWAPLSLLPDFRRRPQGRDDARLTVVGRLKPELSRAQGQAQLASWDARQMEARGGERPATTLYLEARDGTAPLNADIIAAFTPLFFAFGLVLMIGCANVANLLLARGVARQREIGVRLAIGASRSRIVWQLLTENLLLALASAALAFVVSRLALSTIVDVVTTTFPAGIGNVRLAVPPADWRVALFLVGAAMAATVVFALAPSLRATRLDILPAVRGEVVRNVRPGRARDALVALQVTGSALLLICAAVFLRSSRAAAHFDPGIRTSDTIAVSVLDEQRRSTVLDTVRTDASVTAVAASISLGLGGYPAFAAGVTGQLPAKYQYVSSGHFDVVGIDLVRGRDFAAGERSADAAVAIVSARLARQLWPGADGVGQVLRLEPQAQGDRRPAADALPGPRSFVVIGIARDVTGFRLGGPEGVGADVYLQTTAEAPRTGLTVRVRGDSERARQSLIDRLGAVDPNMTAVMTLQSIGRAEEYILGIPFWLTLVLGALALLLTLSGLFSVLSYLVEQRTREIGVRMALGASSAGVAALVLKQSARPVGIGLSIGVGLTAALGAVLLAIPDAAPIATVVRLFDPIAYAGSIVGIVAACACAAVVPALRASWIEPVAALKQD